MKKILISLVFIIAGIVSFSQENIVSWNTSVSRIDDGSYNLIISADIHSDWYIYGMENGDGGPLPLVFSVDESESKFISAVFSEISVADKIYDDVFGMEVNSFSNKADFKCNFVPKKGVESFDLIIDGQACNKKNGLCVQISEKISCNISE
ncbi:MAG TPA: protein-disulfide reductase DsbD family protein [Bacteroidales bacterium]|nr:protein-disulfide reductase DsbD family protein [Bacteroidales bacterium]